MPPQVSIIVPFHNSQATLLRALDSVCAQTAIESVEIIPADDGSTDCSADIVAYFISRHPELRNRIHPIRSRFRRGLAHTMGAALNIAGGTFIARLDADDYMEPGMIAGMLGVADDSVDAVATALFIDRPGRKPRRLRLKSTGGDINAMPIDTLHFSLCNKLIRKSLLTGNSILPVEGIDCWEDLSLSARAMALSRRTVEIDLPFYHYTFNPGNSTLSRSNTDIILRQRLMCALVLEQWFAERHLADRFSPFLNLAKFHAKIKFLRGADRDIPKWRTTFPEVNSAVMSLTPLPFLLRLGFRTLVSMPDSLATALCRMADSLFPPRP